MPKPLTELERRVLDYLIEYLRTNTYQPSIREIGREFSIKSTKTVSELLQSLADKGWIERDPSRSRGVRLLGIEMQATVSVPMTNGTNSEAPSRLELDRRLVGSPNAFIVTMRGNHLIEECLRQGDLLLVEPIDASTLETGDIVMTHVGAEHSARRCVRTGDTLLLEATRPEEVPFTVAIEQAATVVQGVVTTVVRRLRPLAQHAPLSVATAAS